MEIIECVPNFSTSDPKTVESIINQIKKTKKAFLLDHTFDDYYNRLVVTFVGDKESVLKASLNAAFKALRRCRCCSLHTSEKCCNERLR
jgi:glutamate formiminotransferase